jgi:uncharacterized membrane protein YvbJ
MFCNKCGYKLNSGDAFCSKCGNDVRSITSGGVLPETDVQQVSAESDAQLSRGDVVFSSKLLLGGNILRPDRLIINDQNVIYEKK